MIVLYHFTLARFVDSIREHGILSVAAKAEAGMYPPGHRGPPEMFAGEDDLVWLTRKPDGNAGLQGMGPKIRVAVEAEDAVRWTQAADRYGVPPRWREILREGGVALGGPNNDDRDWYVVEDRVPPEQITAIEPWS